MTTKIKQTKKDNMWIACCGCGRPIHIPETTTLIQGETTNAQIIWLSTCPYCGFKHRVILVEAIL